MGCATSHVKDGPSPQKSKKNTASTTFTPKISKEPSFSKYQLLKQKQSEEYNKDEQKFEYNLRSFQVLEKLKDNLTYKKFRLLNTHTNSTQCMIVISVKYHLDEEKIKSMIKITHRSIVNIYHIFQDDNFYYIITDYTNYNIYEAIFNFSSFSTEKLKKVIKSLLNAFKFLLDNKIQISYLDYSKIYIQNEFVDTKYEYYDINDFLEDPNTHNITSSDNSIASKVTLEDIFYQLGKLLVTIYNSNLQYEIPYNIYDDDSALNIEEIYQKIQKDLRYSEKEIIEKLLYYDESTTFETILKLSFFNSYNNINYNVDQTLLKANQNFANFYGKYNLLHSTIHFLHFGAYYKENQEYFEQLFNSFDNLNSEEIKIVQLATNIRSRMKNKFIPYEMMELISFFSNMKITFFNIDNFIKILISYDSELSQNHLKKVFEFLDMNHTGKLKISLLKEIFSLSFHGNRDEFEQVVNEIIEEVDKSEDHTISFNEFLYVLIKIE